QAQLARDLRRGLIAFFDQKELVGLQVRKTLARAAGPLDLEGIDFGVTAEAEGERQFALRAVARAAVDHLPLRAGSGSDADQTTDPVAIRFGPRCLYPQPMIAIPVVSQKVGGPAVGGDQYI